MNTSVARTADATRRNGCQTARVRRRDDETGALLILAIVFLTVVSVIGASLSLWATNNLNNTSKFGSALTLQSASNSVTLLAMQDVRYNFTAATLNALTPQPCWLSASAPVSEQQFDGQYVAVWCSTQWSPLSSATRVVTFSACAEPLFLPGTTSTVINQAATVCAANPFLQAQVQFDDFPSTIGASNCSPQGNSTCGTTFTVLSWAFGLTPPTVISASPLSPGSCPSTKEVDITGTQLSGAMSVNFIQSAANNVVFTGVGLFNGSATGLSTCTPSHMNVSPGSTYQVSVTTPNGTSATVSLAF